jgi:hypothetical protein
MLWRRRSIPSNLRVQAAMIAAVILGLLSVPVECALAAGPHSLYQSPIVVDETMSPSHHHATETRPTKPAKHQHASMPGTAGLSQSSQTDMNANDPESAPVTMAALALLGVVGGLDQVVPTLGPDVPHEVSTPFDLAGAGRSDQEPMGRLLTPDPPPPK